jgi:hypothetical protein
MLNICVTSTPPRDGVPRAMGRLSYGGIPHRHRQWSLGDDGLEVTVLARANGKMDGRPLQGNSQRQLAHQRRLERQRHTALKAAA